MMLMIFPNNNKKKKKQEFLLLTIIVTIFVVLIMQCDSTRIPTDNNNIIKKPEATQQPLGKDETANDRIVKLYKKVQFLNRKCNKPNSQLNGDYLLNEQKKEKEFEKFPPSLQQQRAECNILVVSELANEYKSFIEIICPMKANGLPNMSQQINVRLKTIHGEVKYLKHITMEARKLQRLSLEPLKMLEDPYHPPELQEVVLLLSNNIIQAKEFISEMVRVAV